MTNFPILAMTQPHPQAEQPIPFFSKLPRDVSIEATARCNLRCRHCYNHSAPEATAEMPLQRIEALLDEVLLWDCRAIRITGGEPTVHRQFRELVSACQRRGIRIGLNTNGIYGMAMLDYLRTAPIDAFFVSLEGLEPNNDAIRGRGTFARAVASCRALTAAGQKVVIGFHVGEGNQADLLGLVRLAAEIGADFKVAPLRPVGRATQELPPELIEPRDFYQVVRLLTSLRREHPNINLYTDFDLLEPYSSPGSAVARERESCGAGRTMINIRADGAILPCGFFDNLGDEFVAGNIHQESPTEVWQRAATFSEFRAQQKSDECQQCGFYKGRCRGGCVAIAYAATGRLESLDPTCFADQITPHDYGELERAVTPLAFSSFVEPPAANLR